MILDGLRNLVSFAQFRKCEKNPWRSVTFSTKSDTPPLVFFTFLDCTNGTVSRKAPLMIQLSAFMYYSIWLLR